MSYSGKTFDQITNSIIEQLTKAVANERHPFDAAQVSYKLGEGEDKVRDILRVEGLVNGVSHTFNKDADYRLASNSLEWLAGGTRPDKQSMFQVSYTFGEASGITDVNPGSVVRTVVEAVGREIQYLYAQLDYVYKSGFIDTATGKSLDLVVALLGVSRRSAGLSSGTVTFGRRNPPVEVAYSDELILYDGTESFPLRHPPTKNIDSVKGQVNRKEFSFKNGMDFDLYNDSLRWLATGTRPDHLSEIRVSYKAYRTIAVPKDSTVSTFARRPSDAKIFQTLEDRVLTRTNQGTWEAEVPVQSISAGPDSNVLSGSVTIMPKPIEGIEFVINRNSIIGGSEPEGDNELRDRAKSVIRSLGRATYTSIKEQIEQVPGVVRPIKIEELPIPYNVGTNGETKEVQIPGVVRVIVDGGDEKEIRRVIDETRAAGVFVEIVRPALILLDVKATVYVEKNADASQLESLVRRAIQEYVGSLITGQTIIFARLISSILSIAGISDVSDLALYIFKDGQLVRSVTGENIKLEENQKTQVRNVNLTIRGQ